MLQNTKCECGHQNYAGTVLCEACGKPLFDEEGTSPLEMRYDGVARRSQRQNQNMVEKIWSFFSSVKVAVYLILSTLIGAVIGTILPQENVLLEHVDPYEYYSSQHGTFGKIYYVLGFSDTYGSWWFRALIVMIGASLIICSLDRVLPLYRALSKQKIRKHLSFLRRQKVVYTGSLDKGEQKQWIERFAEAARKKHYRVHMEDGALMAEKYRFSRWGPYINHIGLIILLLAILMRGLPGWHLDKELYLMEGETRKIPGTPYYLKNEKFTVETYSEEEMSEKFRERGLSVDKSYKTEAVLYECTANCDNPVERPVLQEVLRHDIIPNKPLKYKDLLVYLFDYDALTPPRLVYINALLKVNASGETFGPFLLDMKNPLPAYEVGPYRIEADNYFPDLYIQDGQPATKSREPKNPAFVFTINGPGLAEKGEQYLYIPLMGVMRPVTGNQAIDPAQADTAAKLSITINSAEDVKLAYYSSFLNGRVDKALPYILFGAIVFMIGVVMGLYWHHRRIWLRFDGNELTLGAHTNKNWYGLRHETAKLFVRSGSEADAKLLENGVKTSP
jgi:cytochrome c biogenesis protein